MEGGEGLRFALHVHAFEFHFEFLPPLKLLIGLLDLIVKLFFNFLHLLVPLGHHPELQLIGLCCFFRKS